MADVTAILQQISAAFDIDGAKSALRSLAREVSQKYVVNFGSKNTQ